MALIETTELQGQELAKPKKSGGFGATIRLGYFLAHFSAALAPLVSAKTSLHQILHPQQHWRNTEATQTSN